MTGTSSNDFDQNGGDGKPAWTPGANSSQEEKRTVLIVNDTPDQLELMSLFLATAGYKILTAENGCDGFSVVRRERPDLVISDVYMPVANGIDLCRWIRAEPSLCRMPILLASAVCKSSWASLEALKAGADDYIEAPYEPMPLVARVTRLLERKRLEEELAESRKRYRMMFESNPHPMWVYDLETLSFLAVNDAAIDGYGYSRDEFLAMTIKAICPPQDVSAILTDIPATLSGFRAAHVWRHRKHDGTIIDVDITSHDISFAGREARCVLATDITQRRSTEEKLRKSEELLQESQKMEAVGKLAGGVAHDFNNLLTAIIGYSDLLLMRVPQGSPFRSNIEEIKRAGNRAVLLTRQLLAFSRTQVLLPKIINLNTIVSEMEKMLKRLIGEKVELRTELNDLLGNVKADPCQIERVVMNLVINARDSMPKGGTVTITTANVDFGDDDAAPHSTVSHAPFVILTVSDTGDGMDEKTRARIFEPFFTTKEPGKGTGLGLPTVYGIVKQSGGTIWVYSEEGVGTTFKMYLPRVD